MRLVADKFEQDYWIPVQIETPENIIDNFPLAAQAGKGPTLSFGRTIRWVNGQMAA
jgi:maltose-binding protein MalE